MGLNWSDLQACDLFPKRTPPESCQEMKERLADGQTETERGGRGGVKTKREEEIRSKQRSEAGRALMSVLDRVQTPT